MISGFVIPFSCTKLKPQAFLIARFFRIYPTYWIGFTFSLITLKLLNPSNPSLTLHNIIFHYFLLRDFAWLPSLDGISWTLEIELKFYLLCATLVRTIAYVSHNRLLFVIFGLGCITLAPEYIAFIQSKLLLFRIFNALSFSSLFIIYMFIGTFFYWHCCNRISTIQLVVLVATTFTWFSIIWMLKKSLSIQHFTGTINYFISLLIFTLFYIRRNIIAVPYIFKWCANISFSLYVIHPIIGYASLYYLVYIKQLNGFYAILITVLIIFIAAWLMNRIIEVPLNKFGKNLAKRLRG